MFFQRKTTPQYDHQGIWDATKRQDYSSYLDKYGKTPTLREQQRAKAKQGRHPKTKSVSPRVSVLSSTVGSDTGNSKPATPSPQSKQEKRLAMYKVLASAPKKPKRWGLPLVALSAIVFLFVQLAISLVLLLRFAVPYLDLERFIAAGDQQGLSNRLTSVLNSPEAINKLLGDFLAHLTSTPSELYVTAFSMYLTWVLFMVFATFVRGKKSFRLDFGLQFKRWDFPTGLALALIIFGVLSGIQILLQLAGFDLQGADNSAPLRGSTGFWLFFSTFGLGGIIGPFFEELYFRGFVMQGFIRYFRRGLRVRPITKLGYVISTRLPNTYSRHLTVKHWLYNHKYVFAVTLTAIFFGALHTQNVGPTTTFGQNLVPVLTGAIGLVLGAVAVRTRRLGVNIFTHMSYNTVTLTAGFLFTTMVDPTQVILFQAVIPLLLGGAGLLLLFRRARHNKIATTTP